MGYSFRLAARVLLYASSDRQDNTYHGLCYTSRAALAGTRNSTWRIDPTNALTTKLHLAPCFGLVTGIDMFEILFHRHLPTCRRRPQWNQCFVSMQDRKTGERSHCIPKPSIHQDARCTRSWCYQKKIPWHCRISGCRWLQTGRIYESHAQWKSAMPRHL